MYLVFALAASLLLNMFLFWYAIKAGSRLAIVYSNIDEIMSALEDFENHLETIYEMETYYGDETIHGILLHARGIADFLSNFENIYEMSEELSDEAEEEWEWEKEDDKQESGGVSSATKEEKKKAPKKTVFYSGT